MKLWNSEEELFEISKKELFTALVGDILDKMGLNHQFLSPELKPLSPEMVIIGRAMPVLEAEVYSESSVSNKNPIMKKSFGLMFDALDSLKENEVYICSGVSSEFALWGGLMSVRAQHLKAAGAIVNGYSRDTNEILRLKFPTFSKGTYAQDQGIRGKVIDYHCSIEINKVRINPGDIIFGDRDGVLIIPKNAAEQAFAGALEKIRKENKVKKALLNGMTSVEAFKKYKVM